MGQLVCRYATAMSLMVLFVAMGVSYFMRWGWFAKGPVGDLGEPAAAAGAAGEEEERVAPGGDAAAR